MKAMKIYKSLYILSAGCMMLASCSQDLDYKQGYDVEKYFNGSDPRDLLTSFSVKTTTQTIPFIADINAAEDKAEAEVSIKLTRPLEAAEKIEFAVATEAPELTTTYKDYTVLTAANYEAAALEVNAGEAKATAKVTLRNISSLKTKAVLPLTLKFAENSALKLSKNLGVYYVVFEPQQMLSLDTEAVEATLSLKDDGNHEWVDESVLNVQFTAKMEVPAGAKIALVRDDALFQTRDAAYADCELAPANLFTVGEKQEIAKGENNIPLNLQNIDKFTEVKDYLLPLKLVYYDAQGVEHFFAGTTGNVMVRINCRKIYFEFSTTAPEGKALPKTGWELSANKSVRESHPLTNIIDGSADSYWYVNHNDIEMTVDMKEEKTIKGIKFHQPNGYGSFGPSEIKILVPAGSAWKEVATLTIDGTDLFYAKALAELKTSKFKLAMKKGNWGYILIGELTVISE